jgi:hypothetical protein
VPADAPVAHLVGGEGGCIPENVGGILKYQQLMRQLTGKMVIDQSIRNATTSNINPGCEEWWVLFNEEFRSKSNRCNFLLNPACFDYDRTSSNLTTENHRPRPKDINVNAAENRVHLESGLAFDKDKQCTISKPSKPTDMCAYCGATAALRSCGERCIK